MGGKAQSRAASLCAAFGLRVMLLGQSTVVHAPESLLFEYAKANPTRWLASNATRCARDVPEICRCSLGLTDSGYH